MNETYRTLTNEMRRVRKFLNISVKELAEATGASKAVIYNQESRAHCSNWETQPNAMSIYKIRKCVDYLRCQITEDEAIKLALDTNHKGEVKKVETDQPCWECKHCFGGCAWTDRFEPVPGWVAIKTESSSTISFQIFSCPQFAWEDEYHYDQLKYEHDPSTKMLEAVIEQFKKEFISAIKTGNKPSEVIAKHRPDLEGMFGEKWQIVARAWTRMGKSNKEIYELVRDNEPKAERRK